MINSTGSSEETKSLTPKSSSSNNPMFKFDADRFEIEPTNLAKNHNNNNTSDNYEIKSNGIHNYKNNNKTSINKTLATHYHHQHDHQYPSNNSNSITTTTTNTTSLTQKILAEAIGTAILVIFGCGSVCASVYTSALIGLGQSALIWTFGATLAIYVSGSISGGHLNPAVSLAFAMVVRQQRPDNDDDGLLFSWGYVAPYWFGQVIGAFGGSALVYGLFYKAIETYEGGNGMIRGEEGSVPAGFGAYWSTDNVSGAPQAFLIEVMGTAMLTFIIFSITHKANNVPSSAVPPLVGMAIGSIIAIIGSLSGGAINPARDLGPRFVTAMTGWGLDSFKGLGVYLLGPIVGGPLGALMCDKILYNKAFG